VNTSSIWEGSTRICLTGEYLLTILIPVGGVPFTISGEQASRITDMIRPRVVIPMHYKTAARPTWPGTDEQPFLAGKTNVDRAGTSVSFTRGALPASLRTLVMSWQ